LRPLALALLVAAGPAWAQDSLSIKELLDRAQTKSQTDAVEDLIRKLKGGDETKAPPPPEIAAKPAPATEAPPSIGSRSKKESAPAPEVTSAEPVQAAEPQPAQTAAPQEPTRPPPPQQVAAPPPPPEPEASAVSVAPPPVPPSPVATAAPPASSPPVGPDTVQQLPSVDLEIHFGYKSATITPRAIEQLTALGRALGDERLVDQTFIIAGHTDAKGSDGYNLELSRARADAVRNFLITHFAIASDRLIAEGHGYRQLKNARQPLAAENRRVQVTNVTALTARR
jgi:outer membrane protein OmpA-like peptidoglycan-associated protein